MMATTDATDAADDPRMLENDTLGARDWAALFRSATYELDTDVELTRDVVGTLPPRETFGGIYSWDGFFHLSVDEQRLAIPELCRRTLPGGAIMLTVGTGEGEVTGTVAGESVYHASLAPEEYDRRFRDGGFQTVTYVAEDPECLGRSILLASDRRP